MEEKKVTKIIHCADLHLDSKMETNLSPEQAKVRRYEILATFEDMVDYAIEHQIAIILIAGDMFDTKQNQQKQIKNRVLDIIRHASEIDFLYLQGNHDKDNFFRELQDKPDNLKLFSDKWSAYQYGNISIYGVEFNGHHPEEIYGELILNEHKFNIVTLHGQVVNYKKDMQTEEINLSALQNKYIDYLALGHIHEYQFERLDYRGSYCYPGCLEGRGFDECGEKGFVILTINEDSFSHEFISLSRRTFHQIRVDLTDMVEAAAIMTKIEGEIQEIPADDMVKVILGGEILEETEIDLDYMAQKLKSKFFFLKIADQTKVAIDYSRYEHDVSLKGEFVRKVQALELSKEEKSKIIMLGINAIVGKEVGR